MTAAVRAETSRTYHTRQVLPGQDYYHGRPRRVCRGMARAVAALLVLWLVMVIVTFAGMAPPVDDGSHFAVTRNLRRAPGRMIADLFFPPSESPTPTVTVSPSRTSSSTLSPTASRSASPSSTPSPQAPWLVHPASRAIAGVVPLPVRWFAAVYRCGVDAPRPRHVARLRIFPSVLSCWCCCPSLPSELSWRVLATTMAFPACATRCRKHWLVLLLGCTRSGTGYCTEATDFVRGLARTGVQVSAAQHGDSENQEYLAGLAANVRSDVDSYVNAAFTPAASVAVCHSAPGFWFNPLTRSPCPPPETRYYVGRTMFEVS